MKSAVTHLLPAVVLILLLPAALGAPDKYALFERRTNNKALEENNSFVRINNIALSNIDNDDSKNNNNANAFKSNKALNNTASNNDGFTLVDTGTSKQSLHSSSSTDTLMARDRRNPSLNLNRSPSLNLNRSPSLNLNRSPNQVPKSTAIDEQPEFHALSELQSSALDSSVSDRVGRKEPRIVGGSEAIEGQYPFQVSVQVMEMSDSVHICGGVILSINYVLTAAQCVTSQVRSNLRVVAGEQRLSVDSQYEQEREVLTIRVHPDYDEINVRNDLALIRLLQPFKFGFGVTSIPLALEEMPPSTACMTLGWGKTSEGGEYSDVLQELTVRTISDSECESYYSPRDIVFDSMICAGGLQGGSDFCQGDQGGPLVCNDYLHGVASWGYGCGRGYPGVYTQVTHFSEWITEEISNDNVA